MHSALHLSLDCEETQKRETHFIAFCIVQCAFGLRRSNWRCGCRNGGWCTQRRDLARPNCDLYVFGPSRKHFISTHSLPTVFIRANPRDPLLQWRFHGSDQICSSPATSSLPLLFLSRCDLHSPPGERVCRPHCVEDNQDWRTHCKVSRRSEGGPPQRVRLAICVNI